MMAIRRRLAKPNQEALDAQAHILSVGQCRLLSHRPQWWQENSLRLRQHSRLGNALGSDQGNHLFSWATHWGRTKATIYFHKERSEKPTLNWPYTALFWGKKAILITLRQETLPIPAKAVLGKLHPLPALPAQEGS